MSSWFHDPIPDNLVLVNAPGCRTRNEARLYWLTHNLGSFQEPEPVPDKVKTVLRRITNPYSGDKIVDRQASLVKQGECQGQQQHDHTGPATVLKSVRHGQSNLAVEGQNLELVRARTKVPVPTVLDYYTTLEFEHLHMTKAPGVTLESIYGSLSLEERGRMADTVIATASELRQLSSHEITAALLKRKPLPSGLKTVSDFNRYRFRHFLADERIEQYVSKRALLLDEEPHVFSHMDLDYSNIFVAEDKSISCLIDFEQSGFLPAYWEWVQLKAYSQQHPPGTWFRLLTERLGKMKTKAWHGMWEVEQLFQALDEYCFGWGLEPDDRQQRRDKAGAEIFRILGVQSVECLKLPPIDAGEKKKHIFWMENKSSEVDTTK